MTIVMGSMDMPIMRELVVQHELLDAWGARAPELGEPPQPRLRAGALGACMADARAALGARVENLDAPAEYGQAYLAMACATEMQLGNRVGAGQYLAYWARAAGWLE